MIERKEDTFENQSIVLPLHSVIKKINSLNSTSCTQL